MHCLFVVTGNRPRKPRGGFWLKALADNKYDEIGAAARNIHCYIVIGFWKWDGRGADSAYWNTACNCLPSHFHDTFD